MQITKYVSCLLKNIYLKTFILIMYHSISSNLGEIPVKILYFLRKQLAPIKNRKHSVAVVLSQCSKESGKKLFRVATYNHVQIIGDLSS